MHKPSLDVLTHHQDESTPGVNMSSSKIKMGLLWCCVFEPFLTLMPDNPVDSRLMVFVFGDLLMYWQKMCSQVCESSETVCRPSSSPEMNFTKKTKCFQVPSFFNCWILNETSVHPSLALQTGLDEQSLHVHQPGKKKNKTIKESSQLNKFTEAAGAVW